jgi:hypothetical protein
MSTEAEYDLYEGAEDTGFVGGGNEGIPENVRCDLFFHVSFVFPKRLHSGGCTHTFSSLYFKQKKNKTCLSSQKKPVLKFRLSSMSKNSRMYPTITVVGCKKKHFTIRFYGTCIYKIGMENEFKTILVKKKIGTQKKKNFVRRFVLAIYFREKEKMEMEIERGQVQILVSSRKLNWM